MSEKYILALNSYPIVVDRLPPNNPTRRAVINRYWERCVAFDRDTTWELHAFDVPTFNFLQTFFANLIWTPREPIQLEWKARGPFTVDEFCAVTRGWVAIDPGDLITQFLEADQILRLLDTTETFSDAVMVCRAISGEHETSEDVAQFVQERLPGS